jgi:peptidoglycan/xylan/chitin deacetylase (PgdA/CDA1 family)
MELGAVELYRKTGDRKYRTQAIEYARREPVTPWMGADSARHYQWYPFINLGHYALAKDSNAKVSAEFVRNLRDGLERIRLRGKDDPFFFGIPGTWCSNNLTAAALTQCILYRKLTRDTAYLEMEGSLRDWLLGCNPWGVSMIVELPKGGDYPLQPHSYIINYKLGNTTGGLVDGPVYQTIFGSLMGISTEGGTNYEEFQPGNLVYHDSTHDYSTNEPTMDGTASLTYLLSAYETEGQEAAGKKGGETVDRNVYAYGGIIRTDPSKKRISLVFTSDDKNDGAERILSVLDSCGIKGSFFFTGKFLKMFPKTVKELLRHGHYVGSHGYGHLLYASWEDRDSMLVTKEEFMNDMLESYRALSKFGITKESAPYFIPSYEHYNSRISSWAKDLGLQVVDLTGGDYTNGDYTTPDMEHYYSSDFIMEEVRSLGQEGKLNGQIMLIHLGTEPSRTDKLYNRLPELISMLRSQGYEFVPLREAIENS